ncbi:MULTISPECIES: histidine kinase [Streptomyces]|uniref:histidine kinase n=1 Tax=Streptomyces venezuelae TaxID=54571 RepID=A0A5P2BPI6_STRVZ|nr:MULTISPECIES: histidine kinase [Streptomyces]NEA04364.1 sensor histidine kinase [Streptomyces sp. SID10116]MYY82028.1 sensor histidine kinase [Streptomyces sp. SID335]MYZ17377.1 sensor histidine kinase [Streptomyces sp. SID337]NDZ88446.1 sensor histidine kinase [Streptomyces sp. SID10115]NEB43891.1 sensor histidine kinase [Streptomyces sp. SID339]
MSGTDPKRPPEGERPLARRPWTLPSAIAREFDPSRAGRKARRTVRDWIADFTCFFTAVFIGMLGADAVGDNPHVSPGWAEFDQVLGALACAAVWLRRRWPVALALVMVPVAVASDTAGGAAAVALFTLAVHRPFRYVAWIGGVSVAVVPLTFWLRPDAAMPYGVAIAFGVLLTIAVIGWGMFVRSRRELLLSLRDRAVRAENEAALRAEQAQRLAREDIAREMHDVLAHRLTLLSVHAGALEFRPDAPREEIVRAAGVIRESSHEALQDLRQVIGVLRGGESDASGRPQPTLAALDTLIAESRDADMKVVLHNRVADPESVPTALGRTAYRIAQEGLTNARKHAPGAEVTVTVTGAPGEGLTLSVRNPAPPGPVPAVPGSGQGLIGLAERASLAGGRLGHEAGADGGFHLEAWLPWAP